MLDRVIARAASIVTRSEPPRIFAELGRSPGLFRSWLPFGAHLLLFGRLPRAERELVILRTAVLCRCAYEWVQHVPLAARAGVADDEVVALAGGPEARRGWAHRRRLLIDAVDELHAERALSPATAAALGGELDAAQRVELCATVGQYEMLAMVLRSGAVEPEPSARARLRGRPAEIADELGEAPVAV